MSEDQENIICRLKQSIYRLKQLSRQWYLQFHWAKLIYGFIMLEKTIQNRILDLDPVHDDKFMTSNDKKLVEKTRQGFYLNLI